MVPDRAFFGVQRQFAERWAAFASVPLETAYLECTTWCLRQPGRVGNSTPSIQPGRELVAEVRNAANPDGVVHAAAARNEPEVSTGPVLDWSWEAEDHWFLAAQPNYVRPPGFFIAKSAIASQEPVPPAGTT